LKFSKTGQYYFQAQDLATSFPCLEMCPMNKIGITRFVTYVFNESDKCKKRTVDRIKAAGGTIQNGISELEIEIRHSRPPYKEISNIESQSFITTILAGGIGNLLFEISAAYSLSLDNNVNMKFSYNHGTPLQGTNIKQYMNNIFRNINFDKDFNENNYPKYKQLGYEYNKIPYDKSTNLCLDGYFQSEKFFKHNEKAIRELFTLPETDLYYINNKYELLLKKPNVSMHIRRGDYLSLKDHYVPLDDNYYNKALSMFDYIEHVLIFSDDIE